MFTLGVDIGSTTSKAVILKDGQEILATSLVGAGTGTNGPDRAIEAVLAAGNLKLEEITSVYATGYGRKLLKNADGEMSELSCHARGVHHLLPEVRTIIDIGGQDAKVLSLGADGRLMEFLMNDKCAAGTGRFLDVMAGILQLKIEDLEKQAAFQVSRSKYPVPVPYLLNQRLYPNWQMESRSRICCRHLPVCSQQSGGSGKTDWCERNSVYERRRCKKWRSTKSHGAGAGPSNYLFANGSAHGCFRSGALRL